MSCQYPEPSQSDPKTMTDDSFQSKLGGDDEVNPYAAQATANPDTKSLPLRTRRSLGETFDGDRDLYETLGYEENLTADDYWDRYLRQDIARTIVDAPAQTTWKEEPKVSDDDNEDNATAFEKDVQTLYREHELQARFDAVDRLSGIGHFGLLVIGVKDGADLSQPVTGEALSSPDDLAYLMPIAEDRVADWDLVDDDRDERFNLPERYKIDFASRERSVSTSFVSEQDERWVHHSRVIHVPSGNTLDNMLMGRPRLEAVMNRLQDVEKVVGASSEAMWRAADYGLAINSDPEHAGKMPKAEKENVEEELQRWFHGLQPFLRLSGFDVEKLDGDDVDPTGIFEALIKLIAGETGIPQRILTGSERGELASSQDRASWLGRISERQTNFAEPRILRALLDRLVDFGILSEPQGDDSDDGQRYEVEWPSLFELSDVERSEVAKNLSAALSQARNPANPQPLLTPAEIRKVIFDLDPELGAEVDVEVEGATDDPLADLLPPEAGDSPVDGGDGTDDPGDSGDAPPDADQQEREQFAATLAALTSDD